MLAVLLYMFQGGCRKVAKALSICLEPIGKSTVHELAKKVSHLKLVSEPRERRCVAVDETKLRVKGQTVYVWSAVDVDTKELLALDASYQRCELNAYLFLRRVLRACKNKPFVLVDKGPWYPWALERLGLEYKHERFGMRNRVERFFRHLKERTVVFHHKMSARDHVKGLLNLKMLLELFNIYYKTIRG